MNTGNFKEEFIKKYEAYVMKNNISPEVSIIIPCYNVQEYIEECISSVIKQTFKNIEIILINDGSSDLTFNILQAFGEIDKRIILINQENKGVSNARNKGLEIAKGKYITFLDSDDWIDEDYIEKLYAAVSKNSCDIAVSDMIRKRQNSQKYRLKFNEEKIYTSLSDKINITRVPVCCYLCGKLFKKELINNFKFKENVYFEDMLLLPEVLKKSDKLITVPNTNYYYRVNKNSIVKKNQSPKKQLDSYRAHKYIVRFFKENNLILPEKNQRITKYIKYFLNIPILKTKEYKNILTTYLFGFLPVGVKKIPDNLKYKNLKKFFFIRNLDSHFYIELFKFLKISFKNKNEFNYIETKSYGLEKNTRNPKLIVSLTSFPDRINTVHFTINTLLNQTVKPDKVILWLADSQFENKEKDLPETLLKLKEQGLEIKWFEDIRSYKKLVPALIEFPNDIIITADDDLYYQKDWLESLYSSYLKNPDCIHTRRACGIDLKDNEFKVTPHYANNNHKPTYLNQLMGGAGTLYPPHSLYKDILNIDEIKTLIPTHDDIYFWIMAILNRTKIKLVKAKDVNLYTIKNSQNSGLCKIQSTNGMPPREAFKKILEKYPEAYDLLEEETVNE